MKKILGTIAIAALLSSVAFADVKVSASSYVKPTVLSLNVNTKAEKDKASISFFNQGLDWTNSEIGVSASTDNAGVSANIGVDWANGKNNSSGNVYVDNWYGWFAVNGFKTTLGNFNSRFTIAFLNKDIHDSNISFMPGNWSLGVRDSGVAADASNFTRNAMVNTSRTRLALVGDYTFKFGDDMLVLAKAGLTGISADPLFGDAKFNMKTGYAFEAAFQMPLLTVDAIVRVPMADHVSTSVFFLLNPLKAMNLMLGATLGWENFNNPNSNLAKHHAEVLPRVGIPAEYLLGEDFFEFAVDAGLRFAISDNMAITAQGWLGRVMVNSTKEEKEAYKKDKEAAKKAGGDDWKLWQAIDRTLMPWQGGALLNWTMGINDVFKIYAEGGFTGNYSANTVKAQFGTVIKPVANATVVAAIRGQGGIESKVMTLDIPVSVKIAF